jgi:flagellar FliL protein
MKASELNSITGKILLESRIKKRLNSILGAPIIKRIYFSKFIIQ